MNRNLLLAMAVALAAMLAGALSYRYLQPATNLASRPEAAKPVELHSIPLTALAGQETLVGDWRGKILIVNFWAPWCAPCRREIPSLIEIQQQYADRQVEVLGIAFDNEPQVSRFVDEFQINYPIFVAGNRSAMYNAAFGNPSGSLPYTALLDRELRIVYQHNGELTAQQLREQLDRTL